MLVVVSNLLGLEQSRYDWIFNRNSNFGYS